MTKFLEQKILPKICYNIIRLIFLLGIVDEEIYVFCVWVSHRCRRHLWTLKVLGDDHDGDDDDDVVEDEVDVDEEDPYRLEAWEGEVNQPPH